MADFEMSFIGINETGHNIRSWSQSQRQRIAALLYREAVRILELAKARCPVRLGRLRDSGRVGDVVISDNEVSVTISFGDETVTWAVPVHERTYVRHVNGQSKYLESVILENTSEFLANAAHELAL